MTWQTPLFLLIAACAFSYSGYRLSLLYKMAKAHQGRAPKFDRIGERIQAVLIFVLGQKAVLEKRAAGIMHTTIFWGFMIITVGTLEQFVSTIYEPASFQFVGQTLYSALVFLQDIFTFAVLLAVGYACYRR